MKIVKKSIWGITIQKLLNVSASQFDFEYVYGGEGWNQAHDLVSDIVSGRMGINMWKEEVELDLLEVQYEEGNRQ